MFSSYLVLLMRGDRVPVSPTELAQAARCEQQMLFDAKYGAKRSAHWRQRAAEGDQVHAEMHRRATRPKAKSSSKLVWVTALFASLILVALWLGGRG